MASLETAPPRKVVVLDCSQANSPKDFVALFNQTFSLNAQDDSILESLERVLRTDVRISPPIIEIRGIETMEANGHSDFPKRLEDFAQRLKQDENAIVVLVREGTPPRGRLFQHEEFRVSRLQNLRIEQAFFVPGTRAESCALLFIKPEEHLWQRFFLDAGLAFWEEWSNKAIEEEFEELLEDFGLREIRQLKGVVMGEVEALPIGSSSAIRVELKNDGAIWLLPLAPRNLDTDSILSITLPSTNADST